jgi:hypothetical protein
LNLKQRRQRNLTVTADKIELNNKNNKKGSFLINEENISRKLNEEYLDSFLKSIQDINKYLDSKLETIEENKQINLAHKQFMNFKSGRRKNARYHTQPILMNRNLNENKDDNIFNNFSKCLINSENDSQSFEK